VPVATGLSRKKGVFLDSVALNLNVRGSIETSVTIYQPTRNKISEDVNVPQLRGKKLKSKTSS
jgi:hypothetical protein